METMDSRALKAIVAVGEEMQVEKADCSEELLSSPGSLYPPGWSTMDHWKSIITMQRGATLGYGVCTCAGPIAARWFRY